MENKVNLNGFIVRNDKDIEMGMIFKDGKDVAMVAYLGDGICRLISLTDGGSYPDNVSGKLVSYIEKNFGLEYLGECEIAIKQV